ncbi:hypothetical protein HOA92_07555 [archaeon]|nr:hypothetical protein [archaeon]MBT6762870.1 hypothetical protein [archaeon]
MATAFRAKKLLHSLASAQDGMRQKINKKEISQKIDEIKYLSTQKNVPRLSLRKEIVHLEKKLEHIFVLEDKLLKNEAKESQKVSSLKRQITSLKNRINAAEDKELQEKVTKLYHILSELLAKSELKKDVALSQSLLKELNQVKPNTDVKQRNSSRKLVSKPTSESVDSENSLKVRRASILFHRIRSVKHELELKAETSNLNPIQLKKIQTQITELEMKIQDIQHKYPDVHEELNVQNIVDLPDSPDEKISLDQEGVVGLSGTEVQDNNMEIKHTMMMGAANVSTVESTAESGEHMSNLESKLSQGGLSAAEESKIQDEVIGELPLPPPPRIRKK